VSNKGAAIYDGKIYRTTLDAKLKDIVPQGGSVWTFALID
jgi:hypothetical protein